MNSLNHKFTPPLLGTLPSLRSTLALPIFSAASVAPTSAIIFISEDDEFINKEISCNIRRLLILYLSVFVVNALGLSLSDRDIAVIHQSNIDTRLGDLGPVNNFAGLIEFSKPSILEKLLGVL
ncbi:hypothetical protein LVD15_05140 [Fulvivirga maritima]|uniref:hypothetical protein n=1 Tax=Fulvivirga maritima TaxID=2904247 RepID=UPI001F1AEE06|nr:hypothetical protein [Fulvivirga maritima]UII27810.1 hypothetical protein LVD15_05140 [Fulvivirga maritima]